MKLEEITRTEVFFTAHLYFACKNNIQGFQKLLLERLGIDQNTQIIDYSFEVCFFRDFAKANLIERLPKESNIRKSFEKQTFDNVYILSDGSIVLVEAKAHGKFSPGQAKEIKKAAQLIKENKKLLYGKVYIVGLYSSNYSPKESTKAHFDALFTWDELSNIFPSYGCVFNRANEIYNN